MKNRLLNYWNFLTGVKSQTETLNDLKVLLFRDKTTQETISLFADLKVALDEELSKRQVETIKENMAIKNYFNQKARLIYTTVKDSVFNEPIQN